MQPRTRDQEDGDVLSAEVRYSSELQFRRLLDKLPAGAYTCDPEGLITYYNQHAVSVWGRKPALHDPVDRFCGSFKLFAADGTPLDHGECWMALALKRNKGYNGEEIIVEQPGGRRLTVLAYANPIHDDAGVLLGAVNVLVDITNRKEQAALRRRQELERILDRQMDEERRRVGRELHDGFRQQLLGISMLSSTLAKKLEARGVPEAELMHEFSRLLGDANSQLRGLIHNLAPTKVDADGLIPSLQRACTYIERWYGVPCFVHDRNEPVQVGDEVANHLFHIAQEAMINAAKHAHAAQVEVFLKTEGETLVLEVCDDGDGLPKGYDKKASMGITSMRHRAELLGAGLDLDCTAQCGTMVVCKVPLRG